MIKSGLALFVSICLMAVCWLTTAAPVDAHLLSTAPTLESAMASKPLFSFSGKQPTNLGVKDGKLAPCPNSPNCVSSQAPTSDQEHAIAAIAYKSSPTQAMANLKGIIQGMERTKVVNETNDYLYAEFTSALMGFVDDVEFYLDQPAGVIQVRSASRLGKSDLGVNRKRVDEIRVKLTELEEKA
jgi:uncharacterized protein (DUF1499 family)